MIEKLLNDWKGELQIDDKHYTSVQDATSDFKTLSEDSHIFLCSKRKNAIQSIVDVSESELTEYKVTVKAYMTREATPEFDFMAKWNNNTPMPLRTMIGTVEKETKGMVYMKLHGQAEPVIKCMRCGRTLTNEISKKYGIGPECITKIPMLMNLDISDVNTIKKKLVDVVWEGWIIKSAIIEREVV